MCVIAVKETGVSAFPESKMKAMFNHNSDGAGFAYVLDNKVFVEKGLMEYKDFERAYAMLEKTIKKANKDIKDIPIVLHFRIGTHGPNSEGLTHPFPISHDFKHLTALDYNADIVMAHNGIINSVTPRTGWSDTQQYIKDIILPMAKANRYFYTNPFMKELMENTINGSKFVFLDKTGKVSYVGDWKEQDGIKYSNLNHEHTYWTGGYSPYGYGFWADSYSTAKKCKPLPVGSRLFKYQDLDSQWTPVAGAVPVTVSESMKTTFYVDEYGGVYSDRGGTLEVFEPMYTYSTAIDPEGDVIICDPGEGAWEQIKAEPTKV